MLDYQGVTQLHHLDLKMYFLLKMGDFFQSHVWLFLGCFSGWAGWKIFRGNCWDVLLVLSSWSISDNLFISRL